LKFESYVLAEERLTYIPRSREASDVVTYMKYRLNKRDMTSGLPSDKLNNPIIAVPGCPGIGKSTFLQHFPSSDEYKNYVASVSSNNSTDVIVVQITFIGNAIASVNLGLQILYGATGSKKEYDLFCDDFEAYKDLDPKAAVRVLLNTFGESKRVLILVDEIAHVYDEEKRNEIISGLGGILDEFPQVDIVVSALSPQYIKELATNCNREVNYVPLPPLWDTAPGKEKFVRWADNFMKDFQCPHRKVFLSMLRSSYLF